MVTKWNDTWKNVDKYRAFNRWYPELSFFATIDPLASKSIRHVYIGRSAEEVKSFLPRTLEDMDYDPDQLESIVNSLQCVPISIATLLYAVGPEEHNIEDVKNTIFAEVFPSYIATLELADLQLRAPGVV